MSMHIVDDEQQRARPQAPCALRVAGGACASALLSALDDALYIACGPPPRICARGACNAGPCTFATDS